MRTYVKNELGIVEKEIVMKIKDREIIDGIKKLTILNNLLMWSKSVIG